MLKKAGIVAAVAVAALLAVAPLALAGETSAAASPRWVEQVGGNVNDDDTTGLIAVGDLDLLNNLNVCPPVTAGVGVGNVLGILGLGAAQVPVNGGDATCTIDDSGDND